MKRGEACVRAARLATVPTTRFRTASASYRRATREIWVDYWGKARQRTTFRSPWRLPSPFAPRSRLASRHYGAGLTCEARRDDCALEMGVASQLVGAGREGPGPVSSATRINLV